MKMNKKSLLMSLSLLIGPALYGAIDCSEMSYEQIRRKVENSSKTLHTVIDLGSCNPEIIRDKDSIQAFYYKIVKFLETTNPQTPTITHQGEASKGGWAMSEDINSTSIAMRFINNKNGGHIDIQSGHAYDPFALAKIAKAAFKAKENEVTVLLR